MLGDIQKAHWRRHTNQTPKVLQDFQLACIHLDGYGYVCIQGVMNSKNGEDRWWMMVI